MRWADNLEDHMVQVLLHEHPGAEDGYSPSPIVFGAAVAGRTKNVGINIAAIILRCTTRSASPKTSRCSAS
jgi:alkanesulfonate monooxygenase SsuD/methylene tetrahydromethanopterin reductase-like flavin-dependent oxidoreductase (luciferase family)